MTEGADRFEQRLVRLFSSVELSGEFETRLMARVRAESDGIEHVERSFRAEVIAAAQKRRRLLGFLTLDVVAAGALLIFGEALMVRLVQSVPLGGAGAALGDMLSSKAMLGILGLIPLAAVVAILWRGLDYGRSPE